MTNQMFHLMLALAGDITALAYRNMKQITNEESLRVGKTRCVVRFLVTARLLFQRISASGSTIRFIYLHT